MIVNAVFVLAGLGLLLWGLWEAWPPLMFITAGLLGLGLGLMREVPDDATDRSAE